MSATPPPSDGRVVVVGGYGHVGHRLAQLMAERGHRVVVAGRRREPAETAAADLGPSATAAVIDAATGDGVESAVVAGDLVVNASCDQPEASLLRAVVDVGADFADLSADGVSLAAMRDLDRAARAAGTRALVGIGLSPGATNVLARAVYDAAGDPSRVDTMVVLSVLDDFGPAAVDWTLRSLDPAPDPSGRLPTIVPFARSLDLDVDGIGTVTGHEFPFPEQFFLPATLGVDASTSWCAFHPRSAGRVIATVARRRRLRRWLSRPGVRDRAARWSSRLPRPRRPARVAAVSIAGTGPDRVVASVASRSESETTARCAAELLDQWWPGAASPGVVLPESVIDPDEFLARLGHAGMTVRPPTTVRRAGLT